MQDNLLQRADEAIADSERLVDQLHEVRRRAAHLYDWLRYEHQRRMEEAQKRR